MLIPPLPPVNLGSTERFVRGAAFDYFSGFEFYLIPNLIYLRQTATNVTRWITKTTETLSGLLKK